MRTTVLIGLTILAALVFGVYRVEQRVESLRGELIAANMQLKEDKERIHVLNAEWSYLNQPTRLSQMANRHLKLEQVAAAQVKDIGEIPLRPVMIGSK